MNSGESANSRGPGAPPIPRSRPPLPPQRAAQNVMRRYWLLMLAITFSCVAVAASVKPAVEGARAARYKFTPSTVVELAKRTAASAYVPRRLEGNSALQQLSYDQYRDIRFRPEMALWRNEQVPFRVELLPAG